MDTTDSLLNSASMWTCS